MADGHRLHHVDFGGGLGIPYRADNDPPPDPAAYASTILRHAGDLGLKLLFEPGRLIAGNAGILVTRVIYVKPGEGKTFVVVDAAMNDLIRPTLYEAHHDILPVIEARARTAANQGRRCRPGVRNRRLSGAWPRSSRPRRQGISWPS